MAVYFISSNCISTDIDYYLDTAILIYLLHYDNYIHPVKIIRAVEGYGCPFY